MKGTKTDIFETVLDGRMTPSGHNWVQGQGAGPRLADKDADEEQFDAMGNKIANTKKKAKLTSSELRKKKKDRLVTFDDNFSHDLTVFRMARRKRGEEVFSDEDE